VVQEPEKPASFSVFTDKRIMAVVVSLSIYVSSALGFSVWRCGASSQFWTRQ
jgi:hypothetical protein